MAGTVVPPTQILLTFPGVRSHVLLPLLSSQGPHVLLPPPVLAGTAAPPFQILLAFSGVKGALTGTPAYNMRVDECRRAAEAILCTLGRPEQQPILRNVTADELARVNTQLGACALSALARTA